MNIPDNEEVRLALRRAAWVQKANAQRLLRAVDAGTPGLLRPRAQPSPEHYHLIYNVPKDGLSIPHFKEVYLSSRDAYQKVWDIAQEAEPNVEWYGEVGKVGFETRLHGRADLWWIVLEVAACIRTTCRKTLERTQQKRRLVLVPEDDT